MSTSGQQQQKNAWAKGPGAARSSQNNNNNNSRSNTASPSQPNPSQPPTKNVWQTRSAASNTTSPNTSNGQQQQRSDTPTSSNVDRPQHKSAVNGFNTAEVKAFLARGTTSSGGAANTGGSKMASGQAFFQVLAKQIAAFEAGG